MADVDAEFAFAEVLDFAAGDVGLGSAVEPVDAVASAVGDDFGDVGACAAAELDARDGVGDALGGEGGEAACAGGAGAWVFLAEPFAEPQAVLADGAGEFVVGVAGGDLAVEEGELAADHAGGLGCAAEFIGAFAGAVEFSVVPPSAAAQGGGLFYMEFTICGGEETESSDVAADLEHGFAFGHCLYSFWVKECLRWVRPGLHGPLLAVVVVG